MNIRTTFETFLFSLHSASANAANNDLCSQLDFVKSVVVIQETKLHQAAEYIAYQGGFIWGCIFIVCCVSAAVC